MSLKFIDINGQRFRWKDILRMRKEQEKAARQPNQPPLFDLHDDARPVSQRSARGRYESPMLFKMD
jgi:hypothetical protein